MIGIARLAIVGATLVAIGAAASPPMPMPQAAGSVQVRDGMTIYRASCLSCHGAALTGASGPTLKPAGAFVALPSGNATAADLARWIRLNMPPADPGGLTQGQSFAVTALLLTENRRLPAGVTLSAGNASTTKLRSKSQ